MKFSIIIPCRNSFTSLCERFNEIYKQLKSDDELIILDLNSDDGTSKDKFPTKNVKFIKTKEPRIIALENVINDTKNNNIIIIEKLNIKIEENSLKTIQENININQINYYKNLFCFDKNKFKLTNTFKKEISKTKYNRKIKVALCCDVKDWAWWNKSLQIKKYLSDEFDIDLILGYKFDKKYDIYLVYTPFAIRYFKDIPINKILVGITSHSRIEEVPSILYDNNVQNLHVNSKNLENIFKKHVNNIYYVPNGVDEIMFNKYKEVSDSPYKPIFGCVSKDVSYVNKGIKDIILPSVKQTKVLYKSNYSDAYHKKKIAHDKMHKFYNGIDVLLCASMFEGTPNGALEALSCGRPVLTTSVGNMPELIIDGYNGFIVDRNIESFVEKIIWFDSNIDKLEEMSNNSRNSILNGWTWKQQSENYRKMFNDFINR